jgi:antitoxin VapB
MPLRSTVFRSNRSQAVRIPKDLAFPPEVREVMVLREGQRRVIVPADAVWDDFFDADGVTDFPAERAQPPVQERQAF